MPQPLLARVSPDKMTPRMREDYERALAVRDDATFNQVAANAPALYDWYKDGFYAQVFYGGRVDVRAKELLRYRLSMTHGCAYCNKGNSKAAEKAGVTPEQLRHVMDENHAVFSARDRAVLRLADQIAIPNMAGALTPELYRSLREFFDDGQIFELGTVAGILTGMAKFLFVYDLVEREANCPIG